MSAVKTESAAAGPAPIVVDLGRKKKKLVKRLRRGEGRLMTEVQEVLGELRTAGQLGDGAQTVLVVVRQKPAARRGLLGR